MKWMQGILACGLAVFLSACATTTPSTAAPNLEPQQHAVATYRIGMDEVVQVSV